MKHSCFYYFIHPCKLFHIIRSKFSDKYAINSAFKERFGYNIDWREPKTFSEKLQWLKIHDRRPIYTKMVDKYEVKSYVSEIIGTEYIIKTYGIYNSFDEIDFDSLPNKFVLKCTHDSGSIVICKDKSCFNYANARKILENGLKKNFYKQSREWPYKNVKPRILAEEYMQDKNNISLTDYKFYCFNGKPKFLYVSYGLADHDSANISYLTLDWQKAPFSRPDYKEFPELPPKPQNYDLMIKLATKLSKDITFLRVDFYEINNMIYFSELTFFPGGGYTPFEPHEWDEKCGNLLQLPIKK